MFSTAFLSLSIIENEAFIIMEIMTLVIKEMMNYPYIFINTASAIR